MHKIKNNQIVACLTRNPHAPAGRVCLQTRMDSAPRLVRPALCVVGLPYLHSRPAMHCQAACSNTTAIAGIALS